MKNNSATVIAIATVGFVFGLVGLFGSFIPLIGAFALYIGIPAATISLMSLIIANTKKANNIFAVVALTISLIGICVSGWQYFVIKSEIKQIQKSFDQPPTQSVEKAQEEKPYSYKIIDPSKGKK